MEKDMNSELISESNQVILKLQGALKTSECMDFQRKLEEILDRESFLIIDLSELEFMCSGGLRALLAAQAIIDSSDGKKMILKNANKELMDVFTMTGFINILTVI